VPWGWLGNKEVFEVVLKGQILGKPERCPERVYKLMKKCWSFDANLRPTFKQILQDLRAIANAEFGQVQKKPQDPPFTLASQEDDIYQNEVDGTYH
jgi:hypothetical protein